MHQVHVLGGHRANGTSKVLQPSLVSMVGLPRVAISKQQEPN